MKPHVVRPLLAGGALLAIGALILTACSGGGSNGDAGRDDRSVTIVAASEPGGVEPCNAENGEAVILRYNVIQSLTDLDAESRQPVPLLATSWEQVDDLTWVFTLREGVTFHDGAAFDADAAVFGINRALNNDAIACSDTAKIGAGITVTPSATGEYELTITTNVPDPILPLELSYVDLVSPNTPADAETDEPIGTGPFVWDGWDRGQSIDVSRFDDYWGRAPEVESAKLIFRAEDSQRANVVKTGEADIGIGIADQDAPDNDRTKTYPLDAVFAYRLPVQTAPFDDVRVREAFQMAVDKEGITGAIMGRTGSPWDQLVADSNIGFVPDLEPTSFDMDGAKALLAEAAAGGVDVSAEIDLVGLTGQFPASNEVQQAVQQNLVAAGFNVSLRVVDSAEWAELLFKPFPPGQKPTVLSIKHDNSSGDPSSSFTSYMASEGCCGSAMDVNLDGMLAAALAAGGDERATLFQDAARYEYTDVLSIIPVAELNGLMLLSDRVDYEPNALTNRNRFALDEISFR